MTKLHVPFEKEVFVSLSPKFGQVYLVGAGPGDPELITVKGSNCLKSAEVVVYDRLVNKQLLRLTPPDCELIYAGKRKHLHAMSQEEINQTLIRQAQFGKQVVRLKGGDPFIFGRGGEELDALVAAGIECQVVPGITAANGAAAALNIPLTHRDQSSALTFITAHKRHGGLEIDWDLVLGANQTVVFYMGLSFVSHIASELLRRGKPGDTPFSVVSSATGENQLAIYSKLSDIENHPNLRSMPSPALLIMGPAPRCLAPLSTVQQTSSRAV